MTRVSLAMALALMACAPHAEEKSAPILLYGGSGTSANDVAAVETILTDNHFQYATATSPQLNDMSESQLMSYHLLIVPGGNARRQWQLHG